MKQERSYSGVSLACLEIRSRKKKAINSTRNSIYSLKVFYFLLYRRRYSLFLNYLSTRVSDDMKYVCGHRLYACIKYTKIQGPRFQTNYISAIDQKSDLHGTSFQSSPKINRMRITWRFAYNKSLQHPTIAVLLIKILTFFRPLSSVHLLRNDQSFQAMEFVDQHVSEKL